MTHNAKIWSDRKDNSIYVTSGSRDTIKTISIVFKGSAVELTDYAVNTATDTDVYCNQISIDIDIFNELIRQLHTTPTRDTDNSHAK